MLIFCKLISFVLEYGAWNTKILLFMLLPFATNFLGLNDAVLTDHPLEV